MEVPRGEGRAYHRRVLGAGSAAFTMAARPISSRSREPHIIDRTNIDNIVLSRHDLDIVLAVHPIVDYRRGPAKWNGAMGRPIGWGDCMKTKLIGLAVFGLAVAIEPTAQAAYVIDISQVGANVVATGSGTLNFLDQTFPLLCR